MQGDECGNLADFKSRNLAVKYSFSNFSFKVRLFDLYMCSFELCGHWLTAVTITKYLLLYVRSQYNGSFLWSRQPLSFLELIHIVT